MLDPKIPRPIAHRPVAQQEALTLSGARNLIVRLRTAAVNTVRGLAELADIVFHLPVRSALRSDAWPCFVSMVFRQKQTR